MSSLTNYLKTNLIAHATGQAYFSPPDALYAALFTVGPTEVGAGVEVVGPSYTRQVTQWNPPVNGKITNQTDLNFPHTGVTTESWGVATYAGLYDDPLSGNLYLFAPLSAPRTIGVGDSIRLPIGSVTFTLS